MVSPPVLVSKGNVMIGYNPIYEYAALPDVERIVAAIRRSVSTKSERVVAAAVPSGRQPERELAASSKRVDHKIEMPKDHIQKITVPIMGEGIRNAKIVSLLKTPGDSIALDDDLCEVETDKAVYPIQSSFAGTMGEWKTRVGDTVDIGQELGTILTGESADGVVAAAVSAAEPDEKTVEAAAPAAVPGERGRDARRHRG